MHIKSAKIITETFPCRNAYPFCLPYLRNSFSVNFPTAISFFIGENGSGKSTLLRAMARKACAHIWCEADHGRVNQNPFEEDLHKYVDLEWTGDRKPVTFFSAETHQHLAKLIEEWASTDPGLLAYFGGQSLLTQSHGESFLAFFKSTCMLEGVYFLDEPETALSPKRQLGFRDLLSTAAAQGKAQFIIATHSPILMSCPGATINSFDTPAIEPIAYECTEHFQVYRNFLIG